MDGLELSDLPDLTGAVTVVGHIPQFTGNYSSVYRGTWNGNTVAIKVIRATSEPHVVTRRLRRERMVWASMKHPNILPFYGYANDPDYPPFGAFISPWCEGGDVSLYLGTHGSQMPVANRITLWKGVIDGVVYLHGHVPIIVHGDLKPGNVLIDRNGNPQICDFGLARILDDVSTGMTTTTEHTGTSRYLAPELVSGNETVYPTAASDVYALGCLGLELVYLQKPFSSRRNNLQGRIITDIRSGLPPAIELPQKDWLSSIIWDSLKLLWNPDPDHRPTAFAAAHMMASIGLTEPKNLTGEVSIDKNEQTYWGRYSCVYKGSYKGEVVAAKVINLVGQLDGMKRKVKREVTIWATANHQNIHPFYGIAEDPVFSQLGALISPWCMNGDAKTFLETNGQHMLVADRINLWKGVIRGVVYLHSHTPIIIHGDLKPGNILIDDLGIPRICDFGLARIFIEGGNTGETTDSEYTGTTRYLAPEMVASTETDSPTTASDMYAVGCIGLKFIYDQDPHEIYKTNRQGHITDALRLGNPPVDKPPHRKWPAQRVWPLLVECWSKDPAQRPTASVAAHTLEGISFTLPPEIVKRIVFFASTIHRPEDFSPGSRSIWRQRCELLQNICTVSKAYRELAVPFLYRDIRLYLGGPSSGLSRAIDALNEGQGRAHDRTPSVSSARWSHVRFLVLAIESVPGTPTPSGKVPLGIQTLLNAMVGLRVALICAGDSKGSNPVVKFHSLTTLEIHRISLSLLLDQVSMHQAWVGMQRLCIRGCRNRLPGAPNPPRSSKTHFPNLQYIIIQYTFMPERDDLHAMPELLAGLTSWKMPRLKSLDFEIWGFSPQLAPPFFAFLKMHGQFLQHLMLKVAQTSGPSILDLLSLCGDLRSISASFFDLTDLQLVHKTLETISLDWGDTKYPTSSDTDTNNEVFIDCFASLMRIAPIRLPKLKDAKLKWRCFKYHGDTVDCSADFFTNDQFITIKEGEKSYKRYFDDPSNSLEKSRMMKMDELARGVEMGSGRKKRRAEGPE